MKDAQGRNLWLLFYASCDREVGSMLQMLQQFKEAPFVHAIFVSPDSRRPTSKENPSAHTILRATLGTQLCEGDGTTRTGDAVGVANNWQDVLKDVRDRMNTMESASACTSVSMPSMKDALTYVQTHARKECIALLVTGSLYLVGDVLKHTGALPKSF